MKVLLVSAADKGGGAFIAARRLHLALLGEGIDCHLLLAKSSKGLPNALGPTSNAAHTWADLRNYSSLPLHWLNRACHGELRSFNICPSSLHRKINALNADIVNLHWVNREMISVAEIGKINAPIVWTLHDLWPLLGSEHYPTRDRTRQQTGFFDLDPWMYWRKKRHWRTQDISFVGPSQWMCDQVARSRLFSGARRHSIPNPIDLNIYQPIARDTACEILGLNSSKRYLLFGSMSGTSDPRKGFRHLRGALARFSADEIGNLELLTFGSFASPEDLPELWRDRVSALGFLEDDYSLALAYNAAELFIAPSDMDNLPNTIVESLSCGTPVATFSGNGGCSEILEHKVSGYIANKFDSLDLAEGIKWVLNYGERQGLRKRSRYRAKNLFQPSKVARSYACLFQCVLDRRTNQATTHTP